MNEIMGLFGTDTETIQAEVTVSDEGGYLVSWEGVNPSEEVRIYGGRTPETIDRSKPLAVVRNECAALISDMDPMDRYFFEISPAKGRPLMVARRLVSLEGSHNFRDLGGYVTREGRRVKWGKVYRSDALNRLSDQDQEMILRMGIKSVIDFRSTQEAEKAPDRLPDGGDMVYRHWPIQTGEMNFVNAMEKLKQGDYSWLTDEYMIRGYQKNIDEYPEVWGRAMACLADPEALPLVFHCTGGKDRAGTFAALVLAVLGVPDETIWHDHQLTNVFVKPLFPKFNAYLKKHGVQPEKVRPYFLAPTQGVPVLLDRIRSCYGGVDRYLIEKGGVSPAVLEGIREYLLED